MSDLTPLRGSCNHMGPVLLGPEGLGESGPGPQAPLPLRNKTLQREQAREARLGRWAPGQACAPSSGAEAG